MIFENTEHWPETILDHKTQVKISRLGNATLSGDDENESIEYFEGAENPFSMTRRYNIQFLCTYEMGWYPFDLQTCKIILATKGELKLDEISTNFIQEPPLPV